MQFPDTEKALVLIVDDEPANVHVIIETLRKHYRIKVATNGRQALDIASKDDQPDIILLDVMMPDMDGFEVCKILKDQPQTRNIPIIFVTARSTASREFEGLQLEAFDYIHKPVNPALLHLRVRNLVKLKKLQDHLLQASMIDGLTGIPNRRRFEDFLAHRWRVSERNRTHCSVIMIGLTGFKRYNDTMGYQAGDDFLKQVAGALAHCVNMSHDIVARYSGDVFAAVLGDTDEAQAKRVVNNMREAVENLQILESQSRAAQIRVCFGHATSTAPLVGHLLELVRQADERLQSAKMSEPGT